MKGFFSALQFLTRIPVPRGDYRLAIDYVIEVADTSGEWHAVSDATDRAKPGAEEKKGKPAAFTRTHCTSLRRR